MVPKRVYEVAYASVRFMAADLDPLSVTLALRLPPDHVHRDGEPRLTRTRQGRIRETAPYREGMWSMSSRKWGQSPRLTVHLDWLLTELEPKALAIRLLLAEGIRADFLCFSFGSTSRPPSLPREIRERADALGITIAIDHYDSSEPQKR